MIAQAAKGNRVTDRTADADETTHIGKLIRAYAGPRSIARVERDAGLSQGSLNNYVKPSTAPNRIPTIDVIERIAGALGASIEDVSKAFAADMRIPLYDQRPLDEDEHTLLIAYRSLPPALQALARSTLACYVEHAKHHPELEDHKPNNASVRP